MRIHYLILLVLFPLVLITGCSYEDQDVPIPKTENETLNKVLASAPGTVINLNNQPADTLFANAKNIMGDRSADHFSEPVRLGRVVQMVKVGDSLYVADQQQSCIWVLDKQGTIIRKVGRKGRGPGEFDMISAIKKNRKSIFTADAPNARILKFDKELRVKASFEHQIEGNNLTGNESITMTDSLLYIPSNIHTNNLLIKVHTVKAPFDSLTSFLPRIIPPRMQPGAYNGYAIDVNNHGMAAVSYNGLPYIFLYNPEFKLQQVLYLNVPDDDKPENPSTKPTTENARSGVGVTGLITGLDFKDNGDIYFDVGSKFYRLVSDGIEDEYELKNSWFFTFKEAQKRKANKLGINPTTITVAGDKVYLGSIFKEHIYRFSLNIYDQ